MIFLNDCHSKIVFFSLNFRMHFFAFFVLIFLSIWNSSESCSPTQTVLENTEKIATEIKDFSEKTNLILGRILHILEEIDEIAEITEKEKSKPEESNSKQEKLNDSKQEKDSSGPSRFKRGLGLEDLPGQAKSLMVRMFKKILFERLQKNTKLGKASSLIKSRL